MEWRGPLVQASLESLLNLEPDLWGKLSNGFHSPNERSPNLRSSDRLVAGLCALLVRPARLIQSSFPSRTHSLIEL